MKLALSAFVAILLWAGFVFISGFYGWWMHPIAEEGDTRAFMDSAVQMLGKENQGNAALLLIEDGKIAYENYSTSRDPVNRDTLFSAASMSKWIAANGIMKLVEQGLVDLDKPVSEYLSLWHLPASDFDNEEVTVRRLLSHTAGLTDGLGFADYEPGEQLPTTVESLLNPRASLGRVTEISLGLEPGSQWEYSGGGYLILELLIEEVTGLPFGTYIDNVFFQPLGMVRSTYDYLGEIENNSNSYDREGAPATLYKYASSAATGFSTSAADLAGFALAQLSTGHIASKAAVLNARTISDMRAPHGKTMGIDIWGLGTILYAPTKSGDVVFGHDGGNEPAINTTVRINPDNGDAIIVLVTGHPSIATSIGFQWVLWQTGYPGALMPQLAIDSMILPFVIGVLVILLLVGFAGWRLGWGKKAL